MKNEGVSFQLQLIEYQNIHIPLTLLEDFINYEETQKRKKKTHRPFSYQLH